MLSVLRRSSPLANMCREQGRVQSIVVFACREVSNLATKAAESTSPKTQTVAKVQSSKVAEVKESEFKRPYKVGSSLHVYETSLTKFPAPVRPLAIMFSWLNARPSHVDKYASIYQREGVDVVHVFTTPRRLLVGSDIGRAVEEVLSYVSAAGNEQRPLLVHGFSVGGFVYTEMMAAMRSSRHVVASADVKYRIKGTIMDSIVDVEGAPRGISRAVTNNPILQAVIRVNIDFQMNFIFRRKAKRMRQMSSLFHENPFRFPTLMLNSRVDEIGSLESMQRATARWREKGIPVVDQWWSDSRHAAHIREHALEYADLVVSFLHLIGLLDEQFIPLKPRQHRPLTATDQSVNKTPVLSPVLPAYYGA